MKETFYFSHDYNARYDHKIKRLIAKHGYLGYGLFWAIVEDLYNNANALQTDYESIAFDLRTTPTIIESIIKDFGLFVIENGFFGSLSIEERLNARIQKSKKATESAKMRWNKCDSNANALQTQSDCNAIKESKVKESKNNKKELFDFKKSCVDFGFNENLVNDWLIVRKNKKASNTETAFKSFVKQVEKSGLDKNFVLQECVYRNWISFKASWKIEQPQQQKTDSTQPIGTNKKPFTKLRRKDFKSNSEFLGACHKRQENPDPFDFSFPKDLTKDKTDEQIEYMEAELMRDNPNGLRIEL